MTRKNSPHSSMEQLLVPCDLCLSSSVITFSKFEQGLFAAEAIAAGVVLCLGNWQVG